MLPTDKECSIERITADETEVVNKDYTDGERSKVVNTSMIHNLDEQQRTIEAVGKLECKETLLVTKWEADVLLKNKAEKIKYIQEATTTEISFRGSKNDMQREIFMRGSKHNIGSTKLKLKEALHGMKCENLTLTDTEARALLVNRGEIIKTIQMETGARIVVEAHSNRKDRRIQVVGFEKTVTSAKLKIKEALCKMKYKTLFVTNDQVDVLLANKAEKIRTIEEDTATSITVKGRSQCDRERSVVIIGSEKGVASAELEIKHVQERV